MAFNPDNLLRQLFPKPSVVSTQTLQGNLTKEELSMLFKTGLSSGDMSQSLFEASKITYDRLTTYRAIETSLTHWMIQAALELYADTCTTYSSFHNGTVWVTSKEAKYTNLLNDMLDRICIEEKIFDWAWTTATYGDCFVKVNGNAGTGVYSLEDNFNPINVSRLDKNGRLIGFFETPIGQQSSDNKLSPPWQYVHFRILGSKLRRPMHSDPGYSELRTVNFMTPDERKMTTKYGTSVLNNALHSYQRLRLVEDSLMMARICRGTLKYLYKIKVDGNNTDGVMSIIDMYISILKRARALNTTTGAGTTGFFDSKFNPLGSLEDIIVPVWGNVGDLEVEEIGGKPDIKWIADVELFTNQLASSLRVPLALLGGFTEQATGALGSQALEKIDIRFARTSRRLQRAIREGIKRMCQFELSYRGYDPDPTLFEVQMPETSMAEDEQLKESLESSFDIISKFLDIIKDSKINVDNLSVLDYMITKFVKIDDFNIYDYLALGMKEELIAKLEKNPNTKTLAEKLKTTDEIIYRKNPQYGWNDDLWTYFPTTVDKINSTSLKGMNESVWNNLYGDCKIIIKD
jgi:hypothetical protein